MERIRRTLAEEQVRDDTASIVVQVESLQTELRALRAELDALRAHRG